MTNTNYDGNNIFAKLLRKEIPSVRIYENEHIVAFMDVMPQGEGHILVIPRFGSRNLLDAKPETLAHIIEAVQKIAIATKQALNADGVAIMQFNEEAAGQTVYHLHFHIIPRFTGVALTPHNGTMADPVKLEETAKKIRACLQS